MADPLDEDAPPIKEVVGVLVRGFTPGRLWRAIDVHGNLLAETSRPSDFKDLGLLDRSEVKIYHQYVRQDEEWVKETPPLNQTRKE